MASCSRDTKKNPVNLVEAASDGDASVAEDVCDLGFAEAGSVIFERKMQFRIVEGEAAKAIGVGEFTEGAELVVGERRLQFEFGFKKSHEQSIAEEEVTKHEAGKSTLQSRKQEG